MVIFSVYDAFSPVLFSKKLILFLSELNLGNTLVSFAKKVKFFLVP